MLRFVTVCFMLAAILAGTAPTWSQERPLNILQFTNIPQTSTPRAEYYRSQNGANVSLPVSRYQPEMHDQWSRAEVDYPGLVDSGIIVVDTAHHFLYFGLGNSRAMRYGIGVGRDGFTWSGTQTVSAKREWPDWYPPDEMRERQPYLPHVMAGGPNNPLGARALYLGSTLYRIHGTNEPSTIGKNVSSGCIRLRNEDIIDLYNRVKAGARVYIL